MFKVRKINPTIITFMACLVLFFNNSTMVMASQQNKTTDDPMTEKNHQIVVTILGSGLPIPSATQFGNATLVQAGGKNMMFDCGRGCTVRLAQLDKRLITKVDHLFVTHLHSDHLMGIDDLWLNGWTQGRKVPLKTWGPTGTNDMMEGLRTAFKRDIAYRTNDRAPAPSAGLDNAFTDLPAKGGLILDEDGVKVSAFLVDHSTITPAYGYKIEYKGRSVVIAGDTTTTESLYKQGKDVDVLVLGVLTPTIIKYLHSIFDQKGVDKVLGYHMTAEQTADIFKATKPRLGVYYHTDNSEESTKSLLSVVQGIYKGEIVVSYDLFQVFIGDEIKTTDSIAKEKAATIEVGVN